MGTAEFLGVSSGAGYSQGVDLRAISYASTIKVGIPNFHFANEDVLVKLGA